MSKTKRAKELISKTAKKCKVSEELTGDVVNFYYTELRKKMEKLEDVTIGIPSLGTFSISKPKLKKSIKKITEMLISDKPESFKLLKRFNLSTEIRDKQQVLLNKLEKKENERTELKARYKRDMEE